MSVLPFEWHETLTKSLWARDPYFLLVLIHSQMYRLVRVNNLPFLTDFLGPRQLAMPDPNPDS